MPENKIFTFDELKREEKLDLIRTGAIIALQTGAINPPGNDYLIDRAISFAEALYNRFPKNKGSGGVQQIPLQGL